MFVNVYIPFLKGFSFSFYFHYFFFSFCPVRDFLKSKFSFFISLFTPYASFFYDPLMPALFQILYSNCCILLATAGHLFHVLAFYDFQHCFCSVISFHILDINFLAFSFDVLLLCVVVMNFPH